MMIAVTIPMLNQLNGHPLGTATTAVGYRAHFGHTETIVHGSPSLNEHPFNNVAAHHRPPFVAALLSEYYTSVDDLELYPTQIDAPLSEYAIRIGIRVDLGLHFDAQTNEHSTFCAGEVTILAGFSTSPCSGSPALRTSGRLHAFIHG